MEIFKKYVVKLELGRGGHGVVYLAEDMFTDTLVSIKRFCNMKPSNNRQRELWENEIYILNKIRSKDGVAKILEYFEENNTFYIITEYIKGATLNEVMRKHLEPEKIPLTCRSLMLSVLNLHSEGIIHRDICPENIMLSEEYKVTLIDFGSSLDMRKQNSAYLSEPTYRKGFSPIEQYGNGMNTGEWSDIYSTCSVIYYMLTGIFPQDALERLENDNMFNENFLSDEMKNILRQGMNLNISQRLKSVEVLISKFADIAFI